MLEEITFKIKKAHEINDFIFNKKTKEVFWKKKIKYKYKYRSKLLRKLKNRVTRRPYLINWNLWYSAKKGTLLYNQFIKIKTINKLDSINTNLISKINDFKKKI